MAADAYSQSMCDFRGMNNKLTEPNEAELANIIQQLFWAAESSVVKTVSFTLH